jgi:hypothetical protein
MYSNVISDLKQYKKEQNKLKMINRDEYVNQDFFIENHQNILRLQNY